MEKDGESEREEKEVAVWEFAKTDPDMSNGVGVFVRCHHGCYCNIGTNVSTIEQPQTNVFSTFAILIYDLSLQFAGTRTRTSFARITRT